MTVVNYNNNGGHCSNNRAYDLVAHDISEWCPVAIIIDCSHVVSLWVVNIFGYSLKCVAYSFNYSGKYISNKGCIWTI